MSPSVRGPLTLLGRILMCFIFIMSAGGNKIPHFADVAKVMAAQHVPLPEVSLVLAIIFLIVGGASVVVGYQARIGATLLAIFIVLASVFFHNFWALTDPKAQQEQMVQFMKNLAILGGLLMIIAN